MFMITIYVNLLYIILLLLSHNITLLISNHKVIVSLKKCIECVFTIFFKNSRRQKHNGWRDSWGTRRRGTRGSIGHRWHNLRCPVRASAARAAPTQAPARGHAGAERRRPAVRGGLHHQTLARAEDSGATT